MAGDWSLELAPAFGGSVTALRYRGDDVLRPASPDADHPLGTSCFPMVPFVNRIAEGRFAFGGRNVTMRPNLMGDKHVLHGLAWLEPWQIAAHALGSACLIWRCDGKGDWPWAHEAEQRFTLTADGLNIILTTTNLSGETMPLGLGLHPYFLAADRTKVRFIARQVWLTDATLLPEAPRPPDLLGDWTSGASLPTPRLIDNSYEDWDGEVEIAGARSLRLVAQGARDLHFYAPPDADFFCLEPCSHLPDAFNRGDRFDNLAPGEQRAISLSIALAPDALR